MQFKRNSRLIVVLAVVLTAFLLASAQHDMQNMPGMKMGNSKAKEKRTTRKKPTAKRHKMTSMAGTKMSGAKRKTSTRTTTKPSTGTATKTDMQNMPGMNMPGMNMSKPQASPTPTSGQTQMKMPGMPMPQNSPSPSSSPEKMEMNMPGMQMPSASPNPQSSPQKQMEMNMPMPAASPGASPSHTHTPGMNMPMPNARPSPGAMGNMPGMDMSSGTNMENGPLVMSDEGMGVRIGAPQSGNVMRLGQMGSGTSLQPDTSPMYMMDKVKGNWLFMLHYNIIVAVNSQGGPRGVTKFESANWFMPIAFRRVGPGTLQLRGMVSAEPFTFAPGGSPLLFQTGETYKGRPIIDRQHPHDLFMELSAQYTVALGERSTWFTYFAYPGEPALGPPAFMHRASASENPSATLAHHLQDSTHISFGVLTTGFTYRWFKVEGSIFNGREPDEDRYDFDAHKWNSRSARFTFTPNRNWAMQVSYGLLRSPEAQEPNADIRRTTASIQYNRPFHRGNWASAFVWGRNHINDGGEIRNLNAYTAESTVNFLAKNYLYTRLELVDKDELLRAVDRATLGITEHHPRFRIGAYTFGGVRDVWDTDKISVGIGSDVTFYSKPSVLDQIYGNHPVSWRVFVRIRPSKMKMGGMRGMHGSMSKP